jgi:hypothetical protein
MARAKRRKPQTTLRLTCHKHTGAVISEGTRTFDIAKPGDGIFNVWVPAGTSFLRIEATIVNGVAENASAASCQHGYRLYYDYVVKVGHGARLEAINNTLHAGGWDRVAQCTYDNWLRNWERPDPITGADHTHPDHYSPINRTIYNAPKGQGDVPPEISDTSRDNG